jgi:hypothetical protein
LARPEVWIGALSLAAFLALYWVLRGAPLGQAAREELDSDAPSAGYRDRVVATSVIGMLLIAAGGYVAMTVSIPWSLVPFGLGFGTLIALVRANHKYRHASPSLRRVVRYSHAALNGSLLAGILIVGNVLAFKYGDRPLDFTREQAFTLASLTSRQLKSLETPVRFIAVYGNRDVTQRQLDRIIQLLELFKAENPRFVKYEVLGAYGDDVRFRELAEKVPDIAIAAKQGGGVVIEFGEGDGARRLVVRNSEMFEVRGRDGDPARFGSSFAGEDVLTSGLIRLREGKKSRIAFTTGHGEPSVHELDPSKPGVGLLTNRLTAIGAEVVVHNLAREMVPNDTDVVFIIAPQTKFEVGEANRLKAYLDGGGHVIILDDDRKKTGLADWLAQFNVEYGTHLIVDPAYNFLRPVVPAAQILGEVPHPIVESLKGQAVLVPGAVPLVAIGAPGVKQGAAPNAPKREPNPEFTAVPILRTSPQSWAESEPQNRRLTFDPEKDIRGPLTVGIAISTAKKTQAAERPLMVVFSSPYMAYNYYVANDQANLDILINSVSWLRGRRDMQGITAKTHVALTLAADPILRTRLILLPTCLALTVIIGFGIFMFMARRS